MKLRTGQQHFWLLARQHRRLALVARRRFGKTHIFSKLALYVNFHDRQDVVYGSVRVQLAADVIRTMATTMRIAREDTERETKAEPGQIQLVDSGAGKSGKALKTDFSAEEFMDLYDANRLEFRFHHSNSTYNRTKIIALSPQSVGETGWLMADEIGRIQNWAEVQEAIDPIVQSDPSFRVLYCTTPPPDDRHPSFEQLAPPAGLEFVANKKGNIYKSEDGLLILRVDAWDAALDGFPVYDMDTGEPLTPEESRRRVRDKDAWDRNYGCKFIIGGTSACGLTVLNTAQTRGIGKCALIAVDDEADFLRGLAWLRDHLGPGTVGIGFDVATTTKNVSNPSAATIAERNGVESSVPAIFTWKTRDPAIATERLRMLIDTVARRPQGGRAKALAIDATNEKYFSAALAKDFAALIPTLQIVASETVERPGYEPMNYKTFLGDQLVGELDDNHLTLPPERYLKKDWRSVIKEKGAYTCEPDVDGGHGDTFDSTKLALHAIIGAAPATCSRVRREETYSSSRPRRRGRQVVMC